MIRFYKPTLKRSDMDSVLQTMVDEHIGPGEKEALFSQNFAMQLGCSKALSFRTYQDCLKNALSLCDVNEQSTVALSLLSPKVYLDVLKEVGCNIVYVDVDKENGNPDSEAVIESGANVLMLYEPCASIPAKYNSSTTYYDRAYFGDIKIIEDVTSSVGSILGEDSKAGDWGGVVVASLEENDVVSAAGGAVLAVKEELIEKLENLVVSPYQKLSDMNASLGIVQLEKLDENSAKRREICDVFNSVMTNTKNKRFGLTTLDYKSNGSCFCVFMDSKPDSVIEFAKRHEIPLVMTFANSACSDFKGDIFEQYPNTAAYYFRTISFPVYPFLNAQDIQSISRIVANLP